MKAVFRAAPARAAAAALAFAVAASWAMPAAAQDDTVTFGSVLQLTGKDANVGRYYRDAYEFTIDRINARGGITLGGRRLKLALKVLDNQSDTTLGVQLYGELISRDKVNFLLGPYSSQDTLKASTVAEQAQIPMVEGGGASGQIFSRGYKFIFGTLPAAEDYFGTTIAMMGKLDPKPLTVALVSGDDAFDAALTKGTRALLKKSDFKTVIDQQYASRSGDFTSLLSLIKSTAPDAVLWGGLEPEVLNAIRQAKSLDVSPKGLMSVTVGAQSADFRKTLGKDADYIFGMTSWLPSPALKDRWFGDAERFVADFEKAYGFEPDYHAASGAADVEIFAMAIEAADTLDPKAVREAIAKSDFDSLYGHIRFGENGQINLPQTVIQVQDGKIVPIYATDFINRPLYPTPPWTQR